MAWAACGRAHQTGRYNPVKNEARLRQLHAEHEGNSHAAARASGFSQSNLWEQWRKLGLAATGRCGPSPPRQYSSAWQHAVQVLEVRDGTVIVGSDMHYAPGEPRTTAHAAMVRLCKELHPTAVIANGDVLDFPRIGRHPSIAWEDRPTVVQEIAEGQARLREFAHAAPAAQRFWTAGNHDLRFESHIAQRAPDLANVHGVHLHDHFPDWTRAWMVEINPDLGPGATMVKHRWKGGVHAACSNALGAGRSLVTGHLHSAQVSCVTDWNGTRYGVDTGTLAVPYAKAFIDYTEGNPVNWRSAVTVLTFYNRHLLLPEQLHVFDEARRLTMFRGVLQEESV